MGHIQYHREIKPSMEIKGKAETKPTNMQNKRERKHVRKMHTALGKLSIESIEWVKNNWNPYTRPRDEEVRDQLFLNYVQQLWQQKGQIKMEDKEKEEEIIEIWKTDDRVHRRTSRR